MPPDGTMTVEPVKQAGFAGLDQCVRELSDFGVGPLGLGASLSPVRNRDGKVGAFVVDYTRSRSNRDTIVNRLLDWSDNARRLGRVRRADYLVCLAWEAYDRVPC